MKEETAQESRFTSIFKDYYGRYSSDNTVFIGINLTCIIIALIASLTDSALALIGAFMHVDLNSSIVALTSSSTALVGILQGIAAYKKNKNTEMIFNKELKAKELDNVQPTSN